MKTTYNTTLTLTHTNTLHSVDECICLSRCRCCWSDRRVELWTSLQYIHHTSLHGTSCSVVYSIVFSHCTVYGALLIYMCVCLLLLVLSICWIQSQRRWRKADSSRKPEVQRCKYPQGIDVSMTCHMTLLAVCVVRTTLSRRRRRKS